VRFILGDVGAVEGFCCAQGRPSAGFMEGNTCSIIDVRWLESWVRRLAQL